MLLEQIAEISDSLAPLAEKQRGMRIEADDWNALVAAVQRILEIDRAQEKGAEDLLERRFAPAEHEHLGQVAIEWLDAGLQSQVSAGGGSLSVRSAFAELEKKVASLGDQVAKLTRLFEENRKIADSASVDLLDVRSSVKGFEKRFAGVENLATSVTTMSSDVAAATKRMDEVLRLRSSLTDPAGNPINVAKLRDDLTAVESLRRNLEGVDGSLLRARDLEIRIRDLEDSIRPSDGGGLDERLSSLVAGAEGRLSASLTERTSVLGEQLRTASAASLESMGGTLQAELSSRGDAIRASVDEQVTAAETRLSASLEERVDSARDSVQRSVLDSTRGEIDTRLAGLPGQIEASVAAARVSTETTLRAALESTMETRLREQLTAVEGRFGTEMRLIRDELAGMRDDLTGRMTGLVAEERESLLAELGRRLDEGTAKLRSQLEVFLADSVQAGVDSALVNLDARIAGQVKDSLADLDARVATAVRGQLSGLQDQISREVQRQVQALEIPRALADMENRLTSGFRNDLSRLDTTLRADTAKRISEAIALLRTRPL